MFGLPSKKTELQSFCEKLKVENAAAEFEGNEDEHGLRNALAILLIYASYHFWCSIKDSPELKKFWKDTSVNVVIFETLVYTWNNVSSEIEHFLEKAGLDEDDPISEAITDSLHISVSILERYWPGFSAREVLKSRLYLTDPIKAMEKFYSHLLTSYKKELPARSGQGSNELNLDLLTQLPLLAHVGPFTKAFLPGIVETTRRMAQLIVESRD